MNKSVIVALREFKHLDRTINHPRMCRHLMELRTVSSILLKHLGQKLSRLFVSDQTQMGFAFSDALLHLCCSPSIEGVLARKKFIEDDTTSPKIVLFCLVSRNGGVWSDQARLLFALISEGLSELTFEELRFDLLHCSLAYIYVLIRALP